MRTPRKQCESGMYRVICRGVGKQLIFEDNKDRERFLALLAESGRRDSVEVIAWCLMGNHVHLLLHAPIEQISQCMKRICGSYAQLFNMRHARTGHLFQERFRSEPIEDESYLLTVVRYIHFNPEKAGIAKQSDYRWSSYAEYTARKQPRAICSTSLVLGLLGGADNFVSFHETHSAEASCMDVDGPRSATRAMPDKDALEIAQHVLGGRSPSELKSLDREERNRLLALLLAEKLSIRQIERMTGIGRGTIQTLASPRRKSEAGI